MPSRTIAKLDAQSRPLVAGIHEVAEEIGGRLRERFEALLEAGETPPDWALIQRLAGRLLASNNRRLLDLDQHLEQGRTSDKHLRAERDRLAAGVRAALRSARFLLDESFGKELGSGLFRWRNLTKVKGSALLLVARETAGSLRSPQLAMSSLQPSGRLPDVEGLAQALDAAADRLAAHLELLEPTLKRETYSVGLKAQERFETRATRLAAQDLLVGLYRAAGQNHLAARLRPKPRKPGTMEMAPPQEGGVPGMAPPKVSAQEGMAADARN